MYKERRMRRRRIKRYKEGKINKKNVFLFWIRPLTEKHGAV